MFGRRVSTEAFVVSHSIMDIIYIMRHNRGTLSGVTAAPKPARTRAVTASRFRDTRGLCCLTVADTAKLLRVTPRTVQNWESGRVRIPYSAFKLLRILRGYELPGAAWRGYRLKGDTLWSPEGLAFKASDHYWWSLTCRMAAEFRAMAAANRQADQLRLSGLVLSSTSENGITQTAGISRPRRGLRPAVRIRGKRPLSSTKQPRATAAGGAA